MSTEAIILVPGLQRSAVHNQRARFVSGLKHVWEADTLAEADSAPPDAVRLASPERTIDVYEAYWNDLVPSLTGRGLGARVLRGLSLTVFWTFSGIWRGIGRRVSLTLGTMVAGLILVLWYLSVVALFYESVATDPGVLARLPFGLGPVVAGWDPKGLWWVWASLSVVAVVVPVAVLVDIMDFAKIYASEEVLEGDEVALRFQVVSRVRDQVRRALAAGEYRRITVVGHSFGAVLAVDVMAELPLPEGTPFRLVTLGSPAELIARRAHWLEAEIDQCAGRPELAGWVDVVSAADWLASGTTDREVPAIREVTVRPHGTLIDRVAARVHSRYFDSQETINEIVGAAP